MSDGDSGRARWGEETPPGDPPSPGVSGSIAVARVTGRVVLPVAWGGAHVTIAPCGGAATSSR